jgi:MFS family permease
MTLAPSTARRQLREGAVSYLLAPPRFRDALPAARSRDLQAAARGLTAPDRGLTVGARIFRMSAPIPAASSPAQIETVGIGEATLSPAAHSMLFDVFPKRLLATALSIYHAGGFLGAGVSFLIGGLIVDRWNRFYPDAAMAPLHLRGWQVVFFAVGLPGLALAFWIWRIEEPRRESAGPPPSTSWSRLGCDRRRRRSIC